MTHYFTDNRNLPLNRKEISFRFSGNSYTFITYDGVFSKTEVDFGTWVLLDTVSKENFKTILDLGCGYGVVGIVLKTMHPDADVMSVDVNPRAVELTNMNCKENKVHIKALESNIYEKVEGTFHDILTNPPIRAGKKVIYEMFSEAINHLDIGGHLWVVIRKQQGAPSAIDKIIEVFGNCEIVRKEKGYWILKATRN